MQEPWAIREVSRRGYAAEVAAMIRIEAEIFEPERREPEARIVACIEEGVAQVACIQDSIVGYALALPLEAVSETPGPAQDAQLGSGTSAYAVAMGVVPAWRRQGLGSALKRAQLDALRERFRFLCGRQRWPEAAAMLRVNTAFGAQPQMLIYGAYGVPDGLSIYYRIPL